MQQESDIEGTFFNYCIRLVFYDLIFPPVLCIYRPYKQRRPKQVYRLVCHQSCISQAPYLRIKVVCSRDIVRLQTLNMTFQHRTLDKCKLHHQDGDDMLRCCLCQIQYHVSFLQLVKEDQMGMWCCLHCLNLSRDTASSNASIESLASVVCSLMQMHIELLDIIQKQKSVLDTVMSDQAHNGDIYLKTMNTELRQLSTILKIR